MCSLMLNALSIIHNVEVEIKILTNIEPIEMIFLNKKYKSERMKNKKNSKKKIQIKYLRSINFYIASLCIQQRKRINQIH